MEGVLRATRKYAEQRMVWVDKERQMALADLPYMKRVLHSVEVRLLRDKWRNGWRSLKLKV